MKRRNAASLQRIPVREIRAQEVWRSSFPGEELQRLHHDQGRASGVWRVELRYMHKQDGCPAIAGTLSGVLQPLCQRCLQPMQLQFQSSFLWGLVRDDREAAALPAELEPVQLTGNSLDLRIALEDEILLSMPVAYTHGDGECVAPSQLRPQRKMTSLTSS